MCLIKNQGLIVQGILIFDNFSTKKGFQIDVPSASNPTKYTIGNTVDSLWLIMIHYVMTHNKWLIYCELEVHEHLNENLSNSMLSCWNISTERIW